MNTKYMTLAVLLVGSTSAQFDLTSTDLPCYVETPDNCKIHDECYWCQSQGQCMRPEEKKTCSSYVSMIQKLIVQKSEKVFETHGCCQVSEKTTKCAEFEYLNGKCTKLETKTIGCNRGYWNDKAQYDEESGHCKDVKQAQTEAKMLGCCQVSTKDTKCADYEYLDGKCIKLNKREIGCTRGHWNPESTLDEKTGHCKSSKEDESKTETQAIGAPAPVNKCPTDRCGAAAVPPNDCFGAPSAYCSGHCFNGCECCCAQPPASCQNTVTSNIVDRIKHAFADTLFLY